MVGAAAIMFMIVVDNVNIHVFWKLEFISGPMYYFSCEM